MEKLTNHPDLILLLSLLFYDESGILMTFSLPSLWAANGFMAPVARDITATQDCVTLPSVFTFVDRHEKNRQLHNSIGRFPAAKHLGAVCGPVCVSLP